ncbi:MAG: cyclic lactone autoinducer peptide [Clostridium butyricum]|nr:cyclic lactone autoinducer peptide [Clostridium butyricum]
MRNNKNNLKSTIMKKLAGTFISIGDTHANELSVCIGFYEPKISSNLLKSNENSIK